MEPETLPELPILPDPSRRRLEADFDRFRTGLPPDLRAHCLESYGIDIAGAYGGATIANPFGKASGQLSLNVRQVRRDAEAGLGFVVLKTVIAEDEGGARTMGAWAIPETHMRVERIAGARGEPGWTITWKGRGWHESFESYLEFLDGALEAAGERTRVAPSVKYHLPAPGEGEFAAGEYRWTTRRLLETWRRRRPDPMPLEKDFSPTLAGDRRSREQEQILAWLRRVPGLVGGASGEQPSPVLLGMKLMNARFDLDFQVEMVRVLVDEAEGPTGFVVYANRLFDPEREFEETRGVAYGGPDLGRRNLEGLRAIRAAARRGLIRGPLPPFSATGDILTGRRAVEYALLGATSCQMHTLFQLPDSEFAAVTRNKTAAVLHHLLFHPATGLVAWLLHLACVRGRVVNWLDAAEPAASGTAAGT